jgi:3-hydroxyacyl-[acyl-carrier-protein] dehydratase
MADQILEVFPIASPYRFVDAIESVSETGIQGHYTFREEEYFYEGHFPGMPVTPGAVLAECMAQIGLLALGMHLTRAYPDFASLRFLLVSSDLKYRGIVLPGDKVTVRAEKIYFRFRKLKCKASMEVPGKGTVCRGTLSGMLIIPEDEHA